MTNKGNVFMAFSGSGVSSAPVFPEAGAPPNEAELEKQLMAAFGREPVVQMRRIVGDVIEKTLRSAAFFRERQLVRGTQRQCQEEMPARLIEHPMFNDLVEWAVRTTPLVEIGHTRTFTTQEMVDMERRIIDMAGRDNPKNMLPEKRVAAMLDDKRENLAIQKRGLSQEQELAVLAATRTAKNVTVIEGTAGAGKSFTMRVIKDLFADAGYDVMGTALSWNAAKVLEASTGMASSKCVALEGLVRNLLKARDSGSDFFRGPTLLIVDEAGMVGTRHMYNLLSEASRSRYPVKVVLTGDSLQVNPVDAGNALQAIIEYHGTTRIDTIRRQIQASHRLAVRRFSRREAGKGLYPFVQQEAIRWCENQNDQFNMVVRDFLSYRLAHPDNKAIILALRNKDVTELNKRLRIAYRKMGLISASEVEIDVTDGRESWKAAFSVGDEVVLRSNDVNLMKYQIDPAASTTDERHWLPMDRGVFNRNAGRIVGIRRAAKPVGSFDFIIDLAGEVPARVIVNNDTFRSHGRRGMPMVHNFATTIYASQGQTVNQVFLLDSAQMEFRLAYVGMSRHTDSVTVYLDETELHERLDRMMGKSSPTSAPNLPVNARPGEVPELPVALGRYSRSEMLQTVAKTWSTNAENLTAMVWERRQRLGSPPEAPLEERAKVVQGSADDPVIDFVPEKNRLYPLVDVAKVMGLPDPVAETELVRPSEVEANRLRVDPTVIPLRQRHTGHSSSAPVVPGRGFKGKREPEDGEPVQVEMELRQPDPANPFHVPTLPSVPSVPKESLMARALRAVGLAPRGPSVTVPMVPVAPPLGRIDKDGVLQFDHVPQTSGVCGGPSPDFLIKCKGAMWDVGRGEEPRILARDARGQVVARYRLDGRCVVGEGYPPIILNTARPSGSGVGPTIAIVPGPREWFWTAEHQRQRHAADPAKVPHLLWAAKDMDWAVVAPFMRGKPVQILRSRTDDSQLAWAEELQGLLRDRWGVDAVVLPSPPRHAAVPPPARSSPRP